MAVTNTSAGTVLNTRKNLAAKLNEQAPFASWQLFMDFNELAIVEADSPLILLTGTDAQGLDPAINVQEGGVYRLTGGDGNGSTAEDGSQFCMVVPVQADTGGLAFECRLKINDITESNTYVGFTDITTLEMPFEISGTTLTSTCSDGVGFLFDTAMTADAWAAVGVDTNTDATGEGVTDATAPANGVYQVLRCEINALGTHANFFVDGVKVHELTDKVCTPTVDMFFTVCVVSEASAAVNTVDVDYFIVSTDR
jgi:hypothetical protein